MNRDEFVGVPSPLTDVDFQHAADLIVAAREPGADRMRFPVAAIKAVAEVEARGSGYRRDGRPKILFESRWFNHFTGGRFLKSHPHLATRTWVRNYWRRSRRYERLAQAIALDREAALKSTSWGRFQIMGFNHFHCGFKTVEDFVDAMVRDGEASHLYAFVRFCNAKGLGRALNDLDFDAFARVYNGPGYRKNRYARKMRAAYNRFAST